MLYTDGLAERDRRHVPLQADPDLRAALERACVDGPEMVVASVEAALTGAGRSVAPHDDAAVLVLCIDEPDGGGEAAMRSPVAATSTP